MRLILLLAVVVALWCAFIWSIMWYGTPARLYTRGGKKVLVPSCASCDSLHKLKPRFSFK